jgi:glycosyltransferase involved in cell wall biosynthesis
MIKQELVSVIVPVYNGAQYLEAAITSIFAQDYRSIEVIVVDDGSIDDSAQVAKSFKDIRYMFQQNSGPAAARNSGINSANGDFIAFLDSDDLWMPDKLSLQTNYLHNHPDIGLVFAHRRILIEHGVKKPA